MSVKGIKNQKPLNDLEIKVIGIMVEDLSKHELGFSGKLLDTIMEETKLTMSTINIVIRMLAKKDIICIDTTGSRFSPSGGSLFPGDKLIKFKDTGKVFNIV